MLVEIQVSSTTLNMKKKGAYNQFLHLGNPVLIDPLDKLCDIVSVRDVTVDDLVQALKPTAEEVELIQVMSVGQ